MEDDTLEFLQACGGDTESKDSGETCDWMQTGAGGECGKPATVKVVAKVVDAYEVELYDDPDGFHRYLCDMHLRVWRRSYPNFGLYFRVKRL